MGPQVPTDGHRGPVGAAGQRELPEGEESLWVAGSLWAHRPCPEDHTRGAFLLLPRVSRRQEHAADKLLGDR